VLIFIVPVFIVLPKVEKVAVLGLKELMEKVDPLTASVGAEKRMRDSRKEGW